MTKQNTHTQAKKARDDLKEAQAALKNLEKEKRLAQTALVNQEHDTEREVRPCVHARVRTRSTIHVMDSHVLFLFL